MLELRGASGGYGHAQVLRDVTLSLAQGETVAVLGPNGAGKSTLMGLLSGTLPQRGGSVRLDGVEIVAMPSHRIVDLGLVQVPEGRRMFAPLSVLDNLRLGSVALRRRDPAQVARQFEMVYELFPRLAQRRGQAAGTLSGGEQQMVAIGRALMSAPRVLLLDEPFLGLAPLVVEEILRVLNRLRESGLTLLLVEQKLPIALRFAQRAYVLVKGRVRLSESCEALARRDDLAQLYFKLAEQAD
jgi:branched-chain amino acid transport system ATP-binding protein